MKGKKSRYGVIAILFIAMWIGVIGIPAAAHDSGLMMTGDDGNMSSAPAVFKDLQRGDIVTVHYMAYNLKPANVEAGVTYVYGAAVIEAKNGGSAGDVEVSTPEEFVPNAVNYTDSQNITVTIKDSAPLGAIYEVTISTSAAPSAPYFDNAAASRGFEMKPPVKITGMKFNDINNNSQKDAGEPGLSNWQITLTLPNGSTRTAVTDASGNYGFYDLQSGNYSLNETLIWPWVQTFPLPPGIQTVTLKYDNVSNMDFGNHLPLANISVSKFSDANGNGVRDSGEPGLPNWQINMRGDRTDSLLTGSDGTGVFRNLPPGTYRVREVQKTGWNLTTRPVEYEIVLNGVDIGPLVFGNQKIETGAGRLKCSIVGGLTGPSANIVARGDSFNGQAVGGMVRYTEIPGHSLVSTGTKINRVAFNAGQQCSIEGTGQNEKGQEVPFVITGRVETNEVEILIGDYSRPFTKLTIPGGSVRIIYEGNN